MAEHAHITGGGAPPPLTFEVIDLNTHPDGKLLQACAQATKLRDRFDSEGVEPFRDPAPPGARELWRLTRLIADTEAVTPIGVQTKAMFALGDEADLMRLSIGTGVFVSVIKDFLRMGVPA